MIMKAAYEAPLCAMNFVRDLSDFDYAFVHFYDRADVVGFLYREFFEQSKERGRMIVLDNSVFELKKLPDFKNYFSCIMKLKPDYYVLPDVRGDGKATIEAIDEWEAKYGDSIELENKKSLQKICKIGIPHGSSDDEYIQSYKAVAKKSDIVGISYEDFFLELRGPFKGRYKMIEHLKKEGLFANKNHHLLGVMLPQEFKLYDDVRITQVDTSAPITNAYEGIEFDTFGTEEKSRIKIDDIFECPMTFDFMQKIANNISIMENFLTKPTKTN